MNFNSVQQLFMQALLGSAYKHISGPTVHIDATVQSIGTGQHDLVSGGTYSDTVDHDYTIKITATNKFQWKKDNGAFSGDVTITGSAQTLSEGVTVTFGHTTGYTLNDQFTIHAGVGVAVPATDLKNIAINDKGTSVVLQIRDGNSSAGALLYKGATANWNNGDLIQRPYTLQNNSLYIIETDSGNPDLLIGYN
jgi:hypothetical protein